MKKKVWIPVAPMAAILVLVLFGCALGLPENQGTLEFKFALQPKAYENPEPTPMEPIFKAYVYLFRGNKLFREEPYEASLDQDGRGSIKISNLPPGKDYRLVILQSETDFYEGSIYQFVSPPEAIHVRAGRTEEVRISLEGFSYIDFFKSGFFDNEENFLGELPVQSVVATQDFGLAAVSGEKLFVDTLGYGYELKGPKMSNVNSLSTGFSTESPFDGEIILINSENGLHYFDDGGTIEIYSPESPSSKNVLMSSFNKNVFVLQTTNSFIGGYYDGEEATEYFSMPLDPSLINDFLLLKESSEHALYVTTNLIGAFALETGFFDPNSPVWNLEDLLSSPYFHPFSENDYWPSSMPQVLSFGSKSGGFEGPLYIGTTKGLYYTESHGKEGLEEPPQLVQRTGGLSVSKIATSPFLDEVACITSSGVILVDPFGGEDGVVYLPFFEQWVGNVNDIAVYDYDNSGPVLLVAGEKGLAKVSFFTGY